MPLIDINSNLGEHLTLPYVKVHHYCSFSAVLCMQKFSKLLLCVGIPDKQFSIKQCDTGSAHYEAFTASMLSTESTDFTLQVLKRQGLKRLTSFQNFRLHMITSMCVTTVRTTAVTVKSASEHNLSLWHSENLNCIRMFLIFRNFTETRTNI